MDCSPPGSSVHGILQARVATPSSGDFPNPGLLHCRRIPYQLYTIHYTLCIYISDMQMTYLCGRKWRGTKKPLDESERENEKAGLKLSIQKTKIMASGPITSWQIDGETMETVSDFIFGGSKITADGDCSHEIKRRLLFGRKIMTNPDSILKSRDITLSTKVHLVKATVFPVVMNGCELDYEESWAPKNWCFWTVVLEKTLESPLDCKGSNESILKEISPEYSLEGLMLKLKLQYFGHLMCRTDSFEKTLMLGKIKGWRRRGWQRMRWLDGITNSMEEFGDGQGSLACYSPWDHKESYMTEQLNWT